MGENTKSDGYIFAGADTPSRFSVLASTMRVASHEGQDAPFVHVGVVGDARGSWCRTEWNSDARSCA